MTYEENIENTVKWIERLFELSPKDAAKKILKQEAMQFQDGYESGRINGQEDKPSDMEKLLKSNGLIP